MLPELGHFALIIALCLSLLQGSLPLLGVLKKNNQWMAIAPRAAIGQALALFTCFALLAYCFAVNDFSVAYVAQHSHTKLPLIYRICAVWGAHEGSMLLWVTILALWTSVVAIWGRRLPLETQTQVLIILAWVAIGFELFILQTSSA